jgi:hypothetical protein
LNALVHIRADIAASIRGNADCTTRCTRNTLVYSRSHIRSGASCGAGIGINIRAAADSDAAAALASAPNSNATAALTSTA